MIPRQVRPAIYGAALLIVVVGGRMLFAAPALARQHASPLQLLVTLLAAGGAGAAGGLVHGFFGDRLLALPRWGPYVWGVACVSAYMLALVLVAPAAFGERLVAGAADLVLYISLSVFFGLAMGFGYARKT